MLLANVNKDLLNLLLALAIWVVVTGCGLASILTQPMKKESKKFWALVVIFIPLLGLLAYLPFSLDNPKLIHDWIKQLRGDSKTAKQS